MSAVAKDLTGLKPILPMTDSERVRFWNYVDNRGADECWPWLGATNEDGRGRLTLKGRSFSAPRIAFALSFGEPNALVCHTCDNPPCCNPKHLFLGTWADNVHDAVAKGRFVGQQLTHCKNGHEFTPENVYSRPDHDGQRQCRACGRERARIIRAQRKIENPPAPKPDDYRLKKRCKRGHDLQGANLLLGSAKGQVVRRCKICREASEARRGR